MLQDVLNMEYIFMKKNPQNYIVPKMFWYNSVIKTGCISIKTSMNDTYLWEGLKKLVISFFKNALFIRRSLTMIPQNSYLINRKRIWIFHALYSIKLMKLVCMILDKRHWYPTYKMFLNNQQLDNSQTLLKQI